MGMAMIMSSGLIFTVATGLVRVASSAGMPAMQIVLVSGVIRWLGLAGAVWLAGESPFSRPELRLLLLVRSACGWTAFSLSTYAFGQMPIGDATAIFLTSPIWAAILGRFVLSEPLGLAEALAIVLCLGGVVLVMRPTFIFGAPDAPLGPSFGSAETDEAGEAAGEAASVLFPSLVVLVGSYCIVVYCSVVYCTILYCILWNHATTHARGAHAAATEPTAARPER